MTVHAIVLRRKDAGESDRRLTVLSRERGKIDVIAKGARKSASRLASVSDPLASAVLDLAPGKRNLYVTQAQPLSSFRALRGDFDRLSMALALVELYAAVMPYELPDSDAFQLLTASLESLESHERPVVALVWAEVRLLDIAGFQPQFGSCVVTGSPLAESICHLSPSAGGYVSATSAGRFDDVFNAPAEALFGLDRIGEFELPPANLKFSVEALGALLPFWRYIAESALPANETLLANLKTPGIGR